MELEDARLDRLRTDPDVRRRVTGGHACGRRAHPGIHVELNAFTREVLGRVLRRLARVQLDPSPARALEALGATAFEDLYLVVACDRGAEAAWGRLIDVHAGRIDDLARSIGWRDRAASIGQDLLGDLSRPPAHGEARTRLGTYDGSGSLFAWLAVILRRREATRARRRAQPPTPLEPALFDAELAPDASSPVSALIDAEEGARVVHALQAAWAQLSTREQLALHFRFGESLRLKDVGGLLGLSESGTSRLISGALNALRGRVGRVLGSDVIPPARLNLWSALWQAVSAECDREPGPS